MTDKEIILDLPQSYREMLHWVVEDLSLEMLRWQPDQEANNIGVTLWHMSRALDILKMRILEDEPPEMELWHTRGWRERTGYDPRGIGWSGAGNLAGYTLEEVTAVPILPADEILTYFDQAYDALCGYLQVMLPRHCTNSQQA